jgi:PHD/YefM family antitoxin component YafN of YafNO toxin-antitoxin module
MNDTSAMSSPLFQTLDISDFRLALEQLHELIARGNGRIEIRRRGCDDCCILISKSELESLEQALEILANTDSAKLLHEEVRQLAKASTPICSSTAPTAVS